MKINDIKNQLYLKEIDKKEYYYHATYKPYLKSIKTYGLSGGWCKNYEDSQENTVYLSIDPDNALSYAETSDIVPEEYLDQIVILQIDVSKLDQSNLKIDKNVLDNQGDTLEYQGTIPSSAISLYKRLDESWIPNPSQHGDSKLVYDDGEYFIHLYVSGNIIRSVLYTHEDRPGTKFLGEVSTRIWEDDYLIVWRTNLEKEAQGKGLGKKLYEALLKYAPTRFKGLVSRLDKRTNTIQVPKIWQSLGGYEKDGYAIIDRKNTINEDAELWGAADFSIVLRTDDPKRLTLFKKDKAIGSLSFEEITTKFGKYYSILSIFVDKEYRNMRFGRKMYVTLLKNCPNNIEGIASVLSNRQNNKSVSKIYKEFNAVTHDGIAYIDKRKAINENGRIVAGLNTPPGITVDHMKYVGKRLGFNLNREGRPPQMPTNGLINRTPPKDADLSADDNKSFFGHKPQMNKNTNGKSKDMAE